MIVYEYPFNELVRSMLRLEYLFARFNHFNRSDDPELHHNAISMLFDLGDIESLTPSMRAQQAPRHSSVSSAPRTEGGQPQAST